MFDEIQENTIIAFLDTSVLDPMYNSYARMESQFETLARYINSCKLYLFTHEIAIEEIKRHIRDEIPKKIKDTASLMNSKEFAVLKGRKGYEWLSTGFDTKKIVEDTIDAFHKKMKLLKVGIMRTGNISVKSLLSDYFLSNPPFGAKEKKHEFPDAIMFQSIKRVIKEDNKLHVVSSDNDWCDIVKTTTNMVYHKNIGALLDYINKDNAVSAVIKSFIISENIVEFCQDKIREIVEEMDFTVDGMKYDRKGMAEGFEYDDAVLTKIEIDKVIPQAIEDIDCDINQEDTNVRSIVTVLGSALLTFRCTYFDEENSIWDSDEHEYIHKVYGTNDETHEFLIPLRLYISGDYKKELIIDDVKVIETEDNLSVLDGRTIIERVVVNDIDDFYDDQIKFRVDRVFRCPFCQKDISVNLISGDTECIGTDERQMGIEREYAVDVIDKCPHCHNEYRVTGKVWEYPERSFNYEQEVKIFQNKE